MDATRRIEEIDHDKNGISEEMADFELMYNEWQIRDNLRNKLNCTEIFQDHGEVTLSKKQF